MSKWVCGWCTKWFRVNWNNESYSAYFCSDRCWEAVQEEYAYD